MKKTNRRIANRLVGSRIESAGEVINRVAIGLQTWVKDKQQSKTVAGKQWVFVALLEDGRQVIIHQMSPEGHSLIKLQGQLIDGTPCMVFSASSSIQFLVYFAALNVPAPELKEIGFHTGHRSIKVSQL